MTPDRNSPEYRDLDALLHAEEPMHMMAAAKTVATFVIHQCHIWSQLMAAADKACKKATGEAVTPADPVFSGLLLALLHLIMEPANDPGIQKVANNLVLPAAATHGVRHKLDALFTSIGIIDDRHLFN